MSTHRTSYVLYTCTQCNPLHPLPPRLLLAPASPRSRARSRVSHADSRLARSLPKPGSSRAGDVNVPETRATPTTFPASRRCGHLTSVRCQMPDRGPRLLRPGVRACARARARVRRVHWFFGLGVCVYVCVYVRYTRLPRGASVALCDPGVVAIAPAAHREPLFRHGPIGLRRN